MSNYPPGVTGNEYEIAGPDWEGEVEVSCDAQNVQLYVLSGEADTALTLMTRLRVDDPVGAATLPRLVQTVRNGLIEVPLDECPFEGEVYGWAFHGVLTWVCPLCQTEHQEDGRDD